MRAIVQWKAEDDDGADRGEEEKVGDGGFTAEARRVDEDKGENFAWKNAGEKGRQATQ